MIRSVSPAQPLEIPRTLGKVAAEVYDYRVQGTQLLRDIVA